MIAITHCTVCPKDYIYRLCFWVGFFFILLNENVTWYIRITRRKEQTESGHQSFPFCRGPSTAQHFPRIVRRVCTVWGSDKNNSSFSSHSKGRKRKEMIIIMKKKKKKRANRKMRCCAGKQKEREKTTRYRLRGKWLLPPLLKQTLWGLVISREEEEDKKGVFSFFFFGLDSRNQRWNKNKRVRGWPPSLVTTVPSLTPRYAARRALL